uniref:sterol 26-hydroxylase, mitochondrial-like n=1 Tax=Pristiophorus japonicus TaxID=55135 RepID=UPI00398F66E0
MTASWGEAELRPESGRTVSSFSPARGSAAYTATAVCGISASRLHSESDRKVTRRQRLLFRSSALRGPDSILGSTWATSASPAENGSSRPLPPQIGAARRAFAARQPSRELGREKPAQSTVRLSSNMPAGSSTARYKPLKMMPGRSAWSTAYCLFIKGYIHRLHLFQVIERSEFGPVWRTGKMVNVADSRLVEQVLRQEGKYPMRSPMNIWADSRTESGLANGIITAEGEDWYRLRAALNKRMLKPQEAALYQGIINEVATDFIGRIRRLRSANGPGVTVHNITAELQRYTFEAIAAILFETRLGCLEQEMPRESQKFINSVVTMFRSLAFCEVLPKWTRSWLPFWKWHTQAWDNMFDFE